ncbi:unnamed protein product [Calypogeia fissa]
MQLMGMSGQSFKDICDADNAKMRDMSDHVKTKLWRISYVRNESGEDLPRALSFEECPDKADDKKEVLKPLVNRELYVDADQEQQGESRNLEDRRGLVASFGRLKGALSDFSGEIVQSLQKF